MAIQDPALEFSPLGGTFVRDGVMVKVHIFRFAGTDDEWTLEVVDHEGGSTVWTESFSSDQDAYDAFEGAVAEDGIRSFSEELPSVH